MRIVEKGVERGGGVGIGRWRFDGGWQCGNAWVGPCAVDEMDGDGGRALHYIEQEIRRHQYQHTG